jgi:glutamate synthase (NADPH/NADH) small chain
MEATDNKKKNKRTVKTIAKTKTPIPEQDPKERVTNFNEVALGYSEEQALAEAVRCIHCKKPTCIIGCPVEINIPAFIKAIEERRYREAYKIIMQDNIMPAICGRVCPQETQCELTCVVSHKLEPVGIGRLERFVGDLALKEGWGDVKEEIKPNGHKAAMIGSGPASITCAVDLARAGVEVTIFEALHTPGGVLKYGIPEFRLPKALIDEELKTLSRLGVEVKTNAIIGRLYTIPQLMEEMGYETVFVAVGAGYPNFMNIPGEGYNGIFSANEYLTRVNLMAGYEHPVADTPVGMGKNIAVIGSGNTAMDACRVSLRMGAENVYCVYRRTRKESPARAEELEHAIEEGVQFNWLTAPIRIIGNDDGWVKAMECIRMELGEPDASGRRRPIPKEGTEFIFEVDTVVYAIGTSANPIIAQTTPGLNTNKWGYIDVDDDQMTSLPGVFAGGDIVTGGATVILAMGAGRTAARGMLKYMGVEPPPRPPKPELGRLPKKKKKD